jgi:hypothetical protein
MGLLPALALLEPKVMIRYFQQLLRQAVVVAVQHLRL